MHSRICRNQDYLRRLFSAPFPGHAIIMDPVSPQRPWDDDVACSHRPVSDWLPYLLGIYEARLKSLEELDDDSVPYVTVATGTELFAEAFGCPVHIFPGSNPAASALVSTPEDADRLGEPSLSSRPLERVFECARLLRQRVGPDVPIGVPDIQSPFDIAALVWQKESLLLALYDAPQSVHRLVGKCHRLLTSFLQEFTRQFAPVNLCHCPYAWAPPELGCWLSEDEVGSMNVEQFEQFSLPTLLDLSARFGGLFMHCCARADHQYRSFRKIPRLRGLNRVFQEPGPKPAMEVFGPQGTVLMVAWLDERTITSQYLEVAPPDLRLLLNMPAMPLEEAKHTYARLRQRCPRL